MTSRGTASRFLTSVLRNGLGRYVCQLQRLTLTVSRDSPSSRGLSSSRTVMVNLGTQGALGLLEIEVLELIDYIEEKVVDFARQNPGIVIYVAPKNCRVPTVVAEYLNGTVKEEALNKKTADEISEVIQKLVNQSGLEIIRIRKPFHTDNPSIQGQWHPFTNRPSALNVKGVGQQCLPSSDR